MALLDNFFNDGLAWHDTKYDNMTSILASHWLIIDILDFFLVLALSVKKNESKL